MRHKITFFVLFLLLFGVERCYTSKNAQATLFNLESYVSLDETKSFPYTRPFGPAISSDTTIFVGISSYRDNRCGVTLFNLFKKAKFPNRIHVGVAQQIHTEDDHYDCIRDYCALSGFVGESTLHRCPYVNQIHTIVFSYLDSRGPGYARVLQQSLIDGEEFCLQIDAHTDAIPNWDDVVLNEWQKIDNEFAVLSTHLPSIEELQASTSKAAAEQHVPHVCQATFTSNDLVRALNPRPAYHLSRPLLAPYWSAGFSFHKCHLEKKVPYDPQLQFLFDGEEMARYVRMWTHGYDVYSPSVIIMGHDSSGKAMESSVNHLPPPSRQSLGVDGPLAGKFYQPSLDDWIHVGGRPSAKIRARSFEISRHRFHYLLGMTSSSSSLPRLSQSAAAAPDHYYQQYSASGLTLLHRYSLGSLRSFQQFMNFTGLNFQDRSVMGDRCRELSWVPYHEVVVEVVDPHRTTTTSTTTSTSSPWSQPGVSPETSPGDLWGLSPEPLESLATIVFLEAGGSTSLPLRPGRYKSLLLSPSTATTTTTATTTQNDATTTATTPNTNNQLTQDPSAVVYASQGLLGPLDWLIDAGILFLRNHLHGSSSSSSSSSSDRGSDSRGRGGGGSHSLLTSYASSHRVVAFLLWTVPLSLWLIWMAIGQLQATEDSNNNNNNSYYNSYNNSYNNNYNNSYNSSKNKNSYGHHSYYATTTTTTTTTTHHQDEERGERGGGGEVEEEYDIMDNGEEEEEEEDVEKELLPDRSSSSSSSSSSRLLSSSERGQQQQRRRREGRDVKRSDGKKMEGRRKPRSS